MRLVLRVDSGNPWGGEEGQHTVPTGAARTGCCCRHKELGLPSPQAQLCCIPAVSLRGQRLPRALLPTTVLRLRLITRVKEERMRTLAAPNAGP